MSTSTLREIPLNHSMQDGLELETAIIGAGVSGLYSGYRLNTQDKVDPGKVHIFEMGDRIGGRLHSVVLPGMEITGELGGMRYLDSQQIVTQLIEKVFASDLTSIKFPMGDPAHLFFYLRKQRITVNAWEVVQKSGKKLETNYLLNEDDIGFNADQLFNKVVYDVLMADPWFVKYFGSTVSYSAPYTYTFQITSEQWDVIKPQITYYFDGPYYGLKVNDMGFWNLIKDQLSQEGYNFLNDAGGYYSNTINWNAAEAFPYMVGDFSSATVTYKTIQGGYDLIAYALAKNYLATEDTCIWSENQLVTFAHAEGKKEKYHLIFKNKRTGAKWNVYANNVILGLPRRALELLNDDCILFKMKDFQFNLESVIMEPSFKILMGFENPWWKEDFGADSGHSVTDLPMRQCYYFGSDPSETHSLLLASYNDMDTVTFWKALHDNHPAKYHIQDTSLIRVEDFESAAVNDHLASNVMADEAIKELRELHGKNINVPMPFVMLYKDWSDNPYGGGYHAWKAAYVIQSVMEYMRQPHKDQAIYICGEAYSDQQGWVEGALCEAEKILQKSFGLDKPDWLPSSYYLGW